LTSFLTFADSARNGKPFVITVLDDETGRGVPLVELQTVNNVKYYTDSNGVVAFDEPGLMDQTVFFHVKSHGYEYPKDGFGYRGKALAVTPGGSASLKIKRINIAERLYRVTGGGIYRDSVLAGMPVPTKQPVLNGQVFGSDSVVNAIYHGKIYWFWGDTNKPGYPLGNFNVPGATSLLPSDGGLDPNKGVDLEYFVDAQGFAKQMAPLPGDGPTWIWGLVVLKDKSGKERMFADYQKVRGFLNVYERGLTEFNDAKKQFEKVVAFPLDAPIQPHGQTFLHTENGIEYVYYANYWPLTRVVAVPETLRDISQYEAYTCLVEGTRLEQHQFDRDANGKVRYAWKKNTPALSQQDEAKFVRGGHLKKEEALLHLQDVDTGKTVLAHASSVYWNKFRGRWIMISCESGGTSLLGEIWYAEADTPVGPWVYARKIITHEKYSFYNPKQHPMFDQQDGRVIFLEGTYTHTFSGNNEQTPRYDYNQIMYKLTLTDPRMVLPVAIYGGDSAVNHRLGPLSRWQKAPERIAFFAPDRPGKDLVPVYEKVVDGRYALQVGTPPTEKSEPLFYALPADAKATAATVPLATSDNRGCRVWRNPCIASNEHK
jgi:hypothetical protein